LYCHRIYKNNKPLEKKIFCEKSCIRFFSVIDGLREAERLWWILQNYNFKNIKILQGGIESWKGINDEITHKIPEKVKTVVAFPEKTNMKYAISKEEVFNALSKNVVIVDTRSFKKF
jgi:thiosulfate/3-mercaptopyruvate sulfurtransferase